MEVTLVKPKSTETLPDEHSCSDGFIIDTTPPLAGSVHVGIGSIQHDDTQLEIHWDDFRDLEEIGADITHETGIARYILEIGNTSMPNVLQSQADPRGGGGVDRCTPHLKLPHPN